MTEKSTDSKTAFSWNWLVVAAAFITMFGFYGTSGSFGLFIKPLEEALGSTRTATSGAMSTFMAFLGLVGILAGRLTDKYGARATIGIGGLLGALGYLLMSHVGSLWQLHLYFGIMAGTSMGTCFTPIVATVSKWFAEKRVLVVGITTVGIAVGQMAIPPVAALFMANHDWRSTFTILSAILFVTALPSVLLLKKKISPAGTVPLPYKHNKTTEKNQAAPSQAPKQLSATEAIKTLPFWMFCIIGFVTAAGFYIVIVHLIAFAIDSGIQPTNAALILTFLNGGLIAAQLLVWFLIKRLSSRFTIMILLSLQALALFLLMGASGFTVLITLGLIYGFGFGGSNTVRLSMVSEIFGTHSAGAILGLVSLAWSTGGILGPILAGYIFDISQSYDVAFLVGGLLLAIGAAAGFFLKRSTVGQPTIGGQV